MLDEWIICQRQWLYLEPIFSSEDINRQLPVESKRYQTMDRMWRKIMKNAKDTPQVGTRHTIEYYYQLMNALYRSSLSINYVQLPLFRPWTNHNQTYIRLLTVLAWYKQLPVHLVVMCICDSVVTKFENNSVITGRCNNTSNDQSTVKTTTNQNGDNQNDDKLKRRQLKRRHAETTTNQNGD